MICMTCLINNNKMNLKKMLIYICSIYYYSFSRASFDSKNAYKRMLSCMSINLLLLVNALVNLFTNGLFLKIINEYPRYLTIVFQVALAIIFVILFKYLIPENKLMELDFSKRNKLLNNLLMWLSYIVWAIIIYSIFPQLTLSSPQFVVA
jgi:hypothetical protein